MRVRMLRRRSLTKRARKACSCGSGGGISSPLSKASMSARPSLRSTDGSSATVNTVGSNALHSSRASRFGRVKDYYAHADEEICVLVQIETQQGLDNLDAIARVPDPVSGAVQPIGVPGLPGRTTDRPDAP